MKFRGSILALTLLLFVLTAFDGQRKGKLEMQWPSNFPPPVYDVKGNPLTEEGVALGKKLFYDGSLSADGLVSCGFCHQQWAAFTQHGHVVSHGVNDRIGRRNALPLVNLAWQKTFFWDGGVNHLDFAPVNALEDSTEMDETLENVLRKLNASPVYREDFKRAFGVNEISSAEFLKSLSQFMVTMVSANSRYDKFIRNEGEQLNEAELKGLKLFQLNCSSCHATDLFTDGSYRNNGLSSDFRFDKGREEITLDRKDRGRFKAPTLRNVEQSAPYMHDGRFETLEEVLDHYTHDIRQSETLDPLLKQGFKFNEEEKRNIIAFLKTLTDKEFLQDERFSEY